MADEPTQQAKPGSACLGCRSRKLKCSRDESRCTNCLKADLPCVYPTPETGVKRKRGPYRKDKPPRERHLLDLVKYLEPKSGGSQSEGRYTSSASEQWSLPASWRPSPSSASPASGDRSASESQMLLARFRHDTSDQDNSSEALVKDALIALTKSSVSEREANTEKNRANVAPSTSDQPPGMLGVHPPARIVLQYFQLYSSRADPLLKLIHLPTVRKKLFVDLDNLQGTDLNFQTLLFGIYYCAVCTCTALEVREKFAESRIVLLRRYGRTIEANIADNYNIPTLESLQGLLLYLKSVQRAESETNVRNLFALAVRTSQLMGLHEEPGPSFSHYDAEMRRRAWWHICGLESRGAEEGESRTTTIMDNRDVRFPSNYNDVDIGPDVKTWPKPRLGVTDMTYVLVRLELVYLSYLMWTARRRLGPGPAAKAEQGRILEDARHDMEKSYTQYMDPSRPFDWMCLQFTEILMTKYHLMVNHPFGGKANPPNQTEEQRLDLLQSSVKIIRITHMASTDERMEDWRWFYRSWVQWHSLAIVIAELGRFANQDFASDAWAVLDPILADWDSMYRAKKGEPAWEHVNSIIERARQMRHKVRKAQKLAHEPTQAVQISQSGNARQRHSPSIGASPSAWATTPDSTSTFKTIPGGQSISNTDSQALYGFAQGPMAMVSTADDLGQWNGDFNDIDLSAFDTVFCDTAWAFPYVNPIYELGNVQ